MAASWAPKTKASYNSAIKKFYLFCRKKSLDPTKVDFRMGLEFLIYLHDTKQEKFGSIAVARSAISALAPLENNCSFGKDPNISRIIKGMFRERPSLPRKVAIYDAAIVIRYMLSLPDNESLLLEMLSKKLTTLLCLLSGQRSQSIAYLYSEHMLQEESTVTFYIPKLLKSSTPRFHQEPLEFVAFPENRKVCIVDCLRTYINRTAGIRENIQEEGQKLSLILSYAYPHHPVQSATLARYVKDFLGRAGIDLTVFTAHSTRAASSTKANNIGLSLKSIAKAAGWKSPSTFQRFYKFPIRKNFGRELVKASLGQV